MAVSKDFLESVEELLGGMPEFRIKRMFGAAGVYSSDLMFAIADDNVLYLRADAESAPLFEAEGLEQFIYPTKDGEHMSLGYWRAPDTVWDDEDERRRWAMLAMDAAMRKAMSKKPRKKKG